jgi:4-alpha-glucanotransferase
VTSVEAGPVHRLARFLGVLDEYTDNDGQLHRITDETCAALLAAMDVPTASDAEVLAYLEKLERERQREILPPALVIRQEELTAGIEIGLPESVVEAEEPHWCLRVTDGADETGKLRAEQSFASTVKPRESEAWLCFRLPITREIPLGYHHLRIVSMKRGHTIAETTLIVTPSRAYLPPALENGGRTWGPAVQLYGLRSRSNWGMGDFSDLRSLLELAASEGTGAIGLNPLHTLSLHDTAAACPYAPSTRLFLNPWYLDVTRVPDFAECPAARELVASEEFRQAIAAARETTLVDHAAVAGLKRRGLDLLYQSFRKRHLNEHTPRAEAFRQFREQGGEPLHQYALFEAVQEHLAAESPTPSAWPQWPEAYRHPQSPALHEFAEHHADRLDFFVYLQWLADEQLAVTATRAAELCQPVGLYRDLALGVSATGAEAWAWQDLYARGATVGAPPDAFSPRGQDWGLPPLVPERLRQAAYQPFIQTIRANMRHAGAMRIDHVMSLYRLFWVPSGATPHEGAYVRYPAEDLLGILALESHRNRCLVVGEDLGTVPPEVREALQRWGVLSYRVLYFEKTAPHVFRRPREYPPLAAAVVTTHDLPTLAGFLEGRDIDVRAELGLLTDDEAAREQHRARDADRAALRDLLEEEELLSEAAEDAALLGPVHRLIARTPCALALFQLEDALGERDQVNLPGTVEEYPNWRRKLGVDLEDLPEHQGFREMVRAFWQERET